MNWYSKIQGTEERQAIYGVLSWAIYCQSAAHSSVEINSSSGFLGYSEIVNEEVYQLSKAEITCLFMN